jgi:predicted RNase H-like nuclease
VTLVVGVDACAGGWVAVALDDGAFHASAVGPHLVDILEAFPQANALGVDIPIGLPPPYPRAADLAARAFVGPRWQSVFLTPPRELVETASYAEANARAQALIGGGLSKQAHGLSRRILEVDDVARTDERVFEVHPEVCFQELRAAPLDSKHSWNGLTQRKRSLDEAGVRLPDRLEAGTARPDDLLDAAVAAWSADRYARRRALPLPEAHRDRIGAIWR